MNLKFLLNFKILAILILVFAHNDFALELDFSDVGCVSCPYYRDCFVLSEISSVKTCENGRKCNAAEKYKCWLELKDRPPKVENECTRPGVFPDPEDDSKYYVCFGRDGLKKYNFECPKGFYFCEARFKCERDEDYYYDDYDYDYDSDTTDYPDDETTIPPTATTPEATSGHPTTSAVTTTTVRPITPTTTKTTTTTRTTTSPPSTPTKPTTKTTAPSPSTPKAPTTTTTAPSPSTPKTPTTKTTAPTPSTPKTPTTTTMAPTPSTPKTPTTTTMAPSPPSTPKTPKTTTPATSPRTPSTTTTTVTPPTTPSTTTTTATPTTPSTTTTTTTTTTPTPPTTPSTTTTTTTTPTPPTTPSTTTTTTTTTTPTPPTTPSTTTTTTTTTTPTPPTTPSTTTTTTTTPTPPTTPSTTTTTTTTTTPTPTTPPKPVPFVCIRPGVFPNPESCKTYYRCSNSLQPFQYSCPGASYFNEQILKCSMIITPLCHSQISKNSTTHSPLSVLVHETTRPPTVLPTIPTALPESSEAPSVEPTTIEPFSCRRRGIFPELSDCKTYYRCTRTGKKYTYTCPRGTFFNEVLRHCTPMRPVRCQI